MNIASFNINHGGKSNLDSICNFINNLDADIIFIQEIDVLASRSNMQNQFQMINNNCCFASSKFARTMLMEDFSQYGIAVFSKDKNIEYELVNISFIGDTEPRFAILAKVISMSSEIYLWGLHASTNLGIAVKQIQYLLNLSDERCYPNYIIVGDFNFDSIILLNTINVVEKDNENTWPNPNPTKRLDHAICKLGFSYRQQTIKTDCLSDHNAIMVTI